jgi:cell division protein FtsN
MTKDYKPAPPKANPAGKGSPFFSGLLVGLLLGIAASVGVAVFVKQGGNPFQEKAPPLPEIAATEKPADKGTGQPTGQTTPDASAQKKEDRFTFYGILTGAESPATGQEANPAAQQKTPPETSEKPVGENYFLQVGAFQTEQEADNTKAKLALLGLEAVVQTANIPDKGVLHRVRVGPLANIDELNKARAELARNGFNADLINPHNTTDQKESP